MVVLFCKKLSYRSSGIYSYSGIREMNDSRQSFSQLIIPIELCMSLKFCSK